jgi:tetratricopeptide (TPR) repeat protein
MEDERAHLERMIEILSGNLHAYEQQAASFGSLHVPPFLVRQIEETRVELERVKGQLERLESSSVDQTRMEAAARGSSSTFPLPVVPCNLPPRGEFIGREREKKQVQQALATRSYLVAILGIGGIGKTALALEVAHELWEKGLYGAVIWTKAMGGRELDLNDILDVFARTISYPYITQLLPEEKEPEVAKLLRVQKCLLVLDNFETITDESVVHFLLNLPEPSKALIISREQSMQEARVVSLKGMEQSEALALIRNEGKRLGLKSVERAEEKVLLRLYEATGGAPLAIKWAVGHIKQKGQSLDSVLNSLYGAIPDIFESMFGRLWEMLTEGTRRILMVIPIFATSVSKEAIEATSEIQKRDLDEGLGQLVEMSLVEASGRLEEQQRYSVHPLVRAFARAKLREEPGLEEACRLSAARYFLEHFAPYTGYRTWLGYQGHSKIAIELENLLSLREWCWTRGNWALVLEFQRLLSRFLDAQGAWHQRLQLGQQALHAAEHLEDEPAKLKALLEDMGLTYARLGDYQRARDLVQEALRIAETLRNTFYIARSHNLLGSISRYEQDYDSASQSYQKALETAEAESTDDRDRRLIASLNADLGCLAHKVGRLDEARQRFEYACDELEKLGDESRRGRVLCHWGDLASDRGDVDRAKLLYEEGLSVGQKTGRLYYVAEALLGLARLEKRAGNFTQALSQARRAVEIYQRLGIERRIRGAGQLVEELEQTTDEYS